MIKIHRSSTPPPIDVYTSQTVRVSAGAKITRAQSELKKAIEFFTDPSNYKNNTKLVKKSFDFKVYKDPELAQELQKVFGKKCAYCESRFAHVTPKDIEHFRPKSEIEIKGEQPLAPGYYWLAGEWTNLLVSCPDCNRSRDHEVPGQSAKVRLGKQAQFPLSTEASRVRKHTASIAAEEQVRLLLNPCVDDPEKHLTFDDEGLVHPTTDDAGKESEMGKVSIDVYALQRKSLVEERLVALTDIKFHFESARVLARELARLIASGGSAQEIDDKKSQIRRTREYLANRYTAQDAQFLGMTRSYIRKTKSSGGFAELLQMGIDPESLLA